MPDLKDTLRENGTTLFSGRIDVDNKGLAGVVHMSEGQVLEAKLGSAIGEPALWRMLLAVDAAVKVEPGKPRATSGAVLGKPEALLERWDERREVLERVAEKVGGFDRVWAIRFDALRALLEELPDAINPVLRLLDGKRSVRDVLAHAPLDDMLALRILSKLLSLGVLVLPDEEVGRISDAPAVVDVDEGLEAALTASLAEIEAEDEARAALEPIPLTTPRPAQGRDPSTSGAATVPPSSISAPPTTTPTPAASTRAASGPATSIPPASTALASTPPASTPPASTVGAGALSNTPLAAGSGSMEPATTSVTNPGTPRAVAAWGGRDPDSSGVPKTAGVAASAGRGPDSSGVPKTAAAASSEPPGPMPAPDTPRDVTMRPGRVSFAPDTTLPVVTGLPSAPPIETNSELRSWLGSEEAFFSSTPKRTTDVPKVATPWWASFNGAWMLAILVVGIAAGMIIQLRACGAP